MRRPASPRGIGLLEAIAAAAILGVLMMALVQMQSQYTKARQAPLDQGALVRALFTVQADIVKDDRFLPPQEFPAALDPTLPESLDPYVLDPNLSTLHCYDRVGVEVEAPSTSADCTTSRTAFFRIRYVKFRQPDVSFFKGSSPNADPTNELNRIPMSIYRIRVDYDPDQAGNTRKNLTFSRLVTGMISY